VAGLPQVIQGGVYLPHWEVLDLPDPSSLLQIASLVMRQHEPFWYCTLRTTRGKAVLDPPVTTSRGFLLPSAEGTP
jgi:hypothetical protein